jgi:hypothetical protein
MTEEGKKRLSTFCIYAAIPLLLAAIYGMLFVKPEPGWAKLALGIGIPLTIAGTALASRKKPDA